MKLFYDSKLAIEYFKKNRLIIFPTETVYGLGAVATEDENVKKIFQIKNRPENNPLIIHFNSIEHIEEYGFLTETEKKLLKAYTPGPLTLLVKKKKPCFNLATNNSDYFCARIPVGSFIHELINEFGPVSGPSANLSGQLTLTREDMIKESYKSFNIGVYIDDNLIRGIESTIVKVNENGSLSILRKGYLDINPLSKFSKVEYHQEKKIIPGNNFPHYQIKKNIIVSKKKQNEGFHISFGDEVCDFNLSKTSNIEEIKFNYFYALFLGDLSMYTYVTICPFPERSEFHSLEDRLGKTLNKKD